MHKSLLNQAKLSVVIRPSGPLLIKSGLESSDPTRPRMEFVRTRHATFGETIYIPGSSLKGTFRSHAERIFRSYGHHICDLFSHQQRCPRSAAGDSNTDEEESRSAAMFKRHCPACRTFGSLSLAGRANFPDAYPWDPESDHDRQQEARDRANKTETRFQVAIDRSTGRPKSGSLYDLEVVTAGDFYGDINLENFELWQLGLLAATVEEMDRGSVPIGFGQSRGLGRVRVAAKKLQVTTVDSTRGTLPGIRQLCGDETGAAYGLLADDEVVRLPESGKGLSEERSWRGRSITASGKALEQLLRGLVRGPLMALLKDSASKKMEVGRA